MHASRGQLRSPSFTAMALQRTQMSVDIRIVPILSPIFPPGLTRSASAVPGLRFDICIYENGVHIYRNGACDAEDRDDGREVAKLETSRKSLAGEED